MNELFTIEGNKIAYKPHSVQSIALNIFLNDKPPPYIKSKIKEVMLSAGTGGGKTSFGILLLYLMAQKLRSMRDGIIDFIVLAPDYKRLQGIIIDKFVSIFQDKLQVGKYTGNPHFRFRFTGSLEGVNIYFRNASEPHSIEGIHADFIWCDEVGFHSTQVKIPKKAYQVMKDRVRQKDGMLFFTTTPYVLNWVYRDFVKKSNQIIYTVDDDVLQEAIERRDARLLQKYLKKKVIVADSPRLTIMYPSFLNPSYPIENFFTANEDWSIEDFKMRFFGLWVEQKPAILSGFSERVNVIDPFILDPSEADKWELYLGIDFGIDNPFATAFILKSPDGVYYVVGEYIERGYDNTVHAKRIRAKHEALYKQYNIPLKISGIYADPSGSLREIESRQNIATLIKELSQYYEDPPFKPPISRVYYGLDVLNRLLSSGRLKIFSTCEETIDEVYEWRHIGGKHERDHMWDAIRYVLATLSYYDPNFSSLNEKYGSEIMVSKNNVALSDMVTLNTLSKFLDVFNKDKGNGREIS